MDISQVGKLIIVAGIGLVLLGGLIVLAGRIPFIGQLPGDFEIRRGPTTIYFPLASMVILSIILTVLLNLFLRR